MSFVAAVAAAGGIYGGISANQKSQQAKGQQSAAINAGQQGYADRGIFRNASANALNNNQAPDLSSTYGGGPQYSAINNPLLNQANAAQGTLLNSLTNGPDYLGQAKSALSDFDTQSAPVMAAQRRLVGQKASALGRIGSGGVTTDLGNIESDYERNRQLTANELIRNALDRSQQEKYASIGAAQGISNQAYGQSNAERANQQGIAQQGVQNRANQYGAEQGTMNARNQFGLNLGALGTGYNPSGVFQNAANNLTGQAESSGTDAANAFGTAGQIFGRMNGPGSAGLSTQQGLPSAWGRLPTGTSGVGSL